MAEARASRRSAPPRPVRMPPAQAAAVADLFKVLGSVTRVRLLHVLVTRGESRAGELAHAVGMTPQAVSNQLRRLAEWEVVAARRSGAEAHYRVIDPCIEELLAKGLCIVTKEC